MKYYLFVILFVLGLSMQTFSQQIAPGGVQDPILWTHTSQEANQHYVLKDQANKKVLARHVQAYSMNEHLGLFFDRQNFIESIPLKQTDKITCIAVFNQFNTSSEEVFLSISRNDTNQNILTGSRLANLSDYRYLNFGKESQHRSPSIYAYVQSRNYDSLDTRNLLLKIATKSADKSIPAKDFYGVLPEMVLYDRILSYFELCRVQTYFALKYGIGLDQESMPLSYYNSANHKIWDADKNIYYKNRITGIGRDDLSGLNQTISTNMALPNTPKIRLVEKDTLSNETFWIWGDNGKGLKMKSRNNFSKSLDREWLVESFGNFNGKSIIMEMDVLHFEDKLPENNFYWLILDKTGSGKYPVGKTSYIKQSYRKGNSVFFNSLTWDNSFEKNTSFTLIQAPDFFVNLQTELPSCHQPNSGSIKIEVVGGAPFYNIILKKDDNILQNFASQNSIVEINYLNAGRYKLTVIDNTGKRYEKSFFLSHESIPVLELNDSYMLAKGMPLSIDASTNHSVDEYTFSWIQAESIVSNNPILYPERGGFYQVIVCNKEGCMQAAQTEVIVIGESNFKDIQLYPNPSPNGIFYVRINLYEASPIDIRIVDIRGTLIKQAKLSNKATFHVYEGALSVPTGLYLIELTSGKSTETLKLVVN